MKNSYLKALPLIAAVGLGGCGIDPLNKRVSDNSAEYYAQDFGINDNNLDCEFQDDQNDIVECKAVQDGCRINIGCIYNLDSLGESFDGIYTGGRILGHGKQVCVIDIVEPSDSCSQKAVKEFTEQRLYKRNRTAEKKMMDRLDEIGKKTGDIVKACEPGKNSKKEVEEMTCLIVNKDGNEVEKTGTCRIMDDKTSCDIRDGYPDIHDSSAMYERTDRWQF
jgi:hypothetical protein